MWFIKENLSKVFIQKLFNMLIYVNYPENVKSLKL